MYFIRRIVLTALIVLQNNFIAQIITMQSLGLLSAAIFVAVRPFDDQG